MWRVGDNKCDRCGVEATISSQSVTTQPTNHPHAAAGLDALVEIGGYDHRLSSLIVIKMRFGSNLTFVEMITWRCGSHEHIHNACQLEVKTQRFLGFKHCPLYLGV